MTIFEPEVAVAIARCVIARSRPKERRADPEHPSACAWEPYPTDELVRALDGFNAWAGFDVRSNTYSRHEIRVFAELPRDEQHARVVAAQGFEEPVPDPSSTPAASEAWLA